MSSRKWITGLLIAGVALLVVPLAAGTSTVAAAPTDTTFTATLDGGEEVPPNLSPGTGSATVVLNTAETMITVDVSFCMLTSEAISGHIHGPAPPGMNAGVIFDLAPPSSTCATIPTRTFAISAGQVTDLKNGQHYVNIHTTPFMGGEIRGQLTRQPTAIRLLNASAARTPRGVLVRWRTAAETQTLGFNLYRQQPTTLVKVNRALIRSVFGGAAQGHAYSWLDRRAPTGRASYRLQTVNLDGSRAWLGSAFGVRAR